MAKSTDLLQPNPGRSELLMTREQLVMIAQLLRRFRLPGGLKGNRGHIHAVPALSVFQRQQPVSLWAMSEYGSN